MSTAAVFKFTPAFTGPSAWAINLLIDNTGMYMKSNLTNDVVSHDYKLTVLLLQYFE